MSRTVTLVTYKQSNGRRIEVEW